MTSVVKDLGVNSSSCGYCKTSSGSSVAQYLRAYCLTVQDYQELLDRGWRRSGTLLYKPSMKSTCCPMYTIRLKAESFVATKEQMRVLRRMQRYLDGKLGGPQSIGEIQKERHEILERGKGLPRDEHLASVSDRKTPDVKSLSVDVHSVDINGISETGATEEEGCVETLRAAIETAFRNCVESGLLPIMVDTPKVLVKKVTPNVKGKLKNLEGELDYTSNVAFGLAASLKRRSELENTGEELPEKQLKRRSELEITGDDENLEEHLKRRSKVDVTGDEIQEEHLKVRSEPENTGDEPMEDLLKGRSKLEDPGDHILEEYLKGRSELENTGDEPMEDLLKGRSKLENPGDEIQEEHLKGRSELENTGDEPMEDLLKGRRKLENQGDQILEEHLKGCKVEKTGDETTEERLQERSELQITGDETMEQHLKSRNKLEITSVEHPEEYKEAVTCLKPQEIAEILAGKLLQLGELPAFNVKASKGHLNFTVPESHRSNPAVVQANLEKASGAGIKKRLPSSGQSMSVPSGKVAELEIRMKRSAFDPEEYALYKKYQIRVHNDRPEDVKEISYRRFLVDSPLTFVPPANDGTTPSCGFGSFHQQYWIGGRLVAVGVVDVLPTCLSSKYLFCDPDLAFLALGKFSALQEIKWVQEAQRNCPSLQYYYLGYYIHSCQKMRYKAGYYPSELLCPETYRWVSYELCTPFLDKQPYVLLSDITAADRPPSSRLEGNQEAESADQEDAEDAEDEMAIEVDFSHVESDEEAEDAFLDDAIDGQSEALGEVQLCLNGTCISFKHLQQLALEPRPWDTLVKHLQRYLQVVGPSLAARMAYALS